MSLNEYEIEIDGHGHVRHVMALVEVWKGSHFGSSECGVFIQYATLHKYDLENRPTLLYIFQLGRRSQCNCNSS